jgi:hypothetical protein
MYADRWSIVPIQAIPARDPTSIRVFAARSGATDACADAVSVRDRYAHDDHAGVRWAVGGLSSGPGSLCAPKGKEKDRCVMVGIGGGVIDSFVLVLVLAPDLDRDGLPTERAYTARRRQPRNGSGAGSAARAPAQRESDAHQTFAPSPHGEGVPRAVVSPSSAVSTGTFARGAPPSFPPSF